MTLTDATLDPAANSIGRLLSAVVVCAVLSHPLMFLWLVAIDAHVMFAELMFPTPFLAALGYALPMHLFVLDSPDKPLRHALAGFLFPIVGFSCSIVADGALLEVLPLSVAGAVMMLVFRRVALFGVRDARLLVALFLAVAGTIALHTAGL